MTSKIAIIFVILVSAFLFGCTTGQFSLAQAEKPKEITIGWIGSLTGTSVQWGEPALKAANLALKQVNDENLAGKPIKFTVEDSTSQGAVSATIAQKMVSENIKIIFTHNSTESLAIAPIAEKNKVIMLASATSSPDLTTAGDYIFRVTPVNREGEIIARYLNENKISKIALVYENANYPASVAKALQKEYTGVIALTETYTANELDSRTIVSKIKSNSVETVIILPMGVNSSYQLIKTLKEQDNSIKIIGNSSFDSKKTITDLDKLSEGMLFTTLAINDADPKVEEFANEYTRLYGDIPNKSHTLDAATKVFIIADAIKICDENTDCIRNYLYNIENKPTVSGNLTIDNNGDAEKEFVIKTIQNGEIKPIN